jgi:hypothetical protein
MIRDYEHKNDVRGSVMLFYDTGVSGYREAYATDFVNQIDLSGAEINLEHISIDTGRNIEVGLTGNPVVGISGQPIYTTGTVNATVLDGSTIGITGQPIAVTDSGVAWTPIQSGYELSAITTAVQITTSSNLLRTTIDDVILSTNKSQKISIFEESTDSSRLSIYLPASGIVQITPRDGLRAYNTGKYFLISGEITGAPDVVAATFSWHIS